MAAKRRQQDTTPKTEDGVPGRPARTLTMATPVMALSMRLGGDLPDQSDRAKTHDKLIEFVRALARDAARTDHAASRKLAEKKSREET